MKLLHLGLFLLVGILVLKAITGYNKEGFDFQGRKSEQKNYLKSQDKYWDSRLFPEVVKGGKDDSKFLKFNKDKTKLTDISPTATVDKGDISKKIEQCRIINLTADCDQITANGCGYCWDTDKIIYGDATGPATDVCSKKNWIAPGPKTAYFCQKKKEQKLCETMQDCGDSTGKKSICAWCPLTAKGVPKKLGPQGGWIAKYPEDKCDWKSQLLEDYGECKDLKTKLDSKLPNKQWHDRDGAYYSCARYGANNNSGCKSWGNGYTYQNMTGNKACCTCGGGNKEIDFKDNLIDPKDCKRFAQLFPCVGPNMLTGPHSEACLQSQWGKSGCDGNLTERVTDAVDFNNWNTNSYAVAGDNMKESIRKVAQTSGDYNKARPAYKKCFGKEPDPCESRFNPRPIACAKKIYNETGCTAKGKLNPEDTPNWPNSYVNNTWKKGQEGNWSVNTLKSNILGMKRQSQTTTRNPKTNFDNTIYTNLMCNGEMPGIPWDKPCWSDFVIIMTATPGITNSTGKLSFNSAPSAFKSLLAVGSRGWWKNEYTWTGNYEIAKETYVKKYFPFWNFVRTAREYWTSNWNGFKAKMLKVPSVKTGGGSELPLTTRTPGWNPPYSVTSTTRGTRNKLGKCEGDCDAGQCLPGLKCFERNGYEKIPGCSGSGKPGWDYCYEPGGSDCNKEGLTFLNGSPFDNIISTTNSSTDANSKGLFLKCGNDKLISKTAFENENFPYWYFLRVASVN